MVEPMKKLVLAMVASLALTACAAADTTSDSAPESTPDPAAWDAAQELLARHDVAATDVESLIEALDATGLDERPALMASVRPHELLLSDETTAEPLAVPIPDDRFYLSFAPYYDATHDCYFHSLTTCKGEMAGEQVQVTIVDDATGETLVDEQLTAFDNGFVGVWLPRDIEGTLRIEHDGAVAETEIATGPEDATCLTTMQLA